MKEHQLPHKHDQNEAKVLRSLPEMKECVRVASIFKQISDGSRLRIFWFLCHCEECVSNIAAAMNMSDAAASHHLRTLKGMELIESRRDGKEVYYKIADNETARLVHLACDKMLEITCPLEME